MWKADGTIKYEYTNEITSVTYGGKSYIVHNAFLKNAANGGGFGSNSGSNDGITGFWVAKFEMSQQKSTDSGSTWSDVATSSSSVGNVAIANSGATRIKAVSLPEKNSWRYINIANCYTNSKNYGTQTFSSGVTVNSHLMKNSEWGAVAYLAHSQYGLNGEEIRINNYYNNGVYKTGQAATTVDASYSTSTYTYDLADSSVNPLGPQASTTKNVYGIYDLSGGAWEYVAAFNKKYSGDYFTGNSYKDANSTHFASVTI